MVDTDYFSRRVLAVRLSQGSLDLERALTLTTGFLGALDIHGESPLNQSVVELTISRLLL